MVEFLSTPREGRPASPSQPLQRLHCHKRQDKLLFKSCQPVNFELFGIQEFPSDNQIRNLLDPIAPGLFYPVFSSTFEHLEKAGYLKGYRFFEGCLLVPLDGTEYFRSSKIHCSHCSVTHHTNGKVSYSHKILTPVVVAPGNPRVLV